MRTGDIKADHRKANKPHPPPHDVNVFPLCADIAVHTILLLELVVGGVYLWEVSGDEKGGKVGCELRNYKDNKTDETRAIAHTQV